MRKDGIMKNTAMARRLVAGMTLAIAATAGAMPTKQELAEALPFVQDLTADDMRALKAKEKEPGAVAAAHLALADKAETEAGKYLLLQGAFRLYARGGDYDSAAAVLQRIRTEISDLPPEVVVEIVNKEMSRVASEKAPKVLAIFRDAQRTLKYRKLIVSLEREAKARPTDTSIRRRIAECHAHLGDWAKALPIFAKLGDDAAKYELDPASAKGLDALKAADFWWNYKAADTDTFKAHAASLYRAAVDGGVATGLRREMANKRIAEVESSGIAVAATAPATKGGAPTLAPAPTPVKQPAATIASTPKPSAPVTVKGNGPWTLPKNFNTPLERSLDLGGGVQMPFCAIPAGSFRMMDHKVTITRPYWISKTPLTINQVIAEGEHDDVSTFKEITKSFKGRTLLLNGGEPENIIQRMNNKYKSALPPGYVFRLPTEGEFVYAFTAGKNDDDFNACPRDDTGTVTQEAFLKRGWAKKSENGKIDIQHPYYQAILVDLPKANAFGFIPWNATKIYVFNVLDKLDVEWKGKMLFRRKDIQTTLRYADEEVDPLREGKYPLFVGSTISSIRTIAGKAIQRKWGVSCIVIGPDLESEKKAAGK